MYMATCAYEEHRNRRVSENLRLLSERFSEEGFGGTDSAAFLRQLSASIRVGAAETSSAGEGPTPTARENSPLLRRSRRVNGGVRVSSEETASPSFAGALESQVCEGSVKFNFVAC